MPGNKRLYKGTGPYTGYFELSFPDKPIISCIHNMNADSVASYMGQSFNNDGSDQDITLEFNNSYAASLDSEYTICVTSEHRMTLDFGKGRLFPGNVNSCWSEEVGSRIKIKSDGENWYIMEKIGTWHF